MTKTGSGKEVNTVEILDKLARGGFSVMVRQKQSGKYLARIIGRDTTGEGGCVNVAITRLHDALCAEGYFDE